MQIGRVEIAGILFALILSASANLSADNNQKIGMDLYESLSEQILVVTQNFNDDMARLNDLNANTYDDNFVFPDKLKSKMDKDMEMIIVTLEEGITKAKETNSRIVDRETNRACNLGLDRFREEALNPMSEQVKEFVGLDVNAEGKLPALYQLASDLSIRCPIATGRFVIGELASCLIVIE